MNQAPRFTRRARWAVPSGAVAAVGVIVAGSVLTSAQAAPSLQPRTPAQLIAAIAANESAPAALSGTIVSNAALGLPDLPGIGNPTSITSLLTGSHTINIWYARPGQLRLALPVQLGETDLRVNGRQVWLWDSQRNTATHILPPVAPLAGQPAGLPPGTKWSSGKPHSAASFSSPCPSRASSASASSSMAYSSTLTISSPTPQQVARQLLAAVGPTTTVGVQSNVMIAGRAAYQLTLAPKNPGSLVGRVTIAVDGSRYIPLRVQVFARGAASPAFQLGYTSISFGRPAASNFTFTPPPGAKVRTARPAPGLLAGFPLGAMSGINGGGFAGPPRHLIIRHGKIVGPSGARRTAVRLLPVKRVIRVVPLPKGSLTMNPLRAAKGTRIALPGAPVQEPAAAHAEDAQDERRTRQAAASRRRLARARLVRIRAGNWRDVPAQRERAEGDRQRLDGCRRLPRREPGRPGQASGGEAGALLRSATAVHGSWGSGRLLRTSLLSVLITSNGKALVGAVTPSVLYAAAAQAK